MADETPAAALEREHHEIDDGIAAFAASVEAGTPDVTPLQRAMSALRRHIYIEEQFLFPPMRAGGLMAPIFVMIREHGEIWRSMAALDEAIAADPAGAAASQVCQKLAGELQAHNEKEEPVIYPQTSVKLSEYEQQRLAEMIERGRTPDGWECQAAAAAR